MKPGMERPSAKKPVRPDKTRAETKSRIEMAQHRETVHKIRSVALFVPSTDLDSRSKNKEDSEPEQDVKKGWPSTPEDEVEKVSDKSVSAMKNVLDSK